MEDPECHHRPGQKPRDFVMAAAQDFKDHWQRERIADVFFRECSALDEIEDNGIVLGMIAATAAILLAMGRIPICECGYVLFWTPADDVAGSSQHIADWYTLSHIIHGFIFYWVLWLLFRRNTVCERALGAIFLEAAWEVAENSPWIIDRYREATIAVGYTGDSVLNSVFDIIWMLVGFFFAWRMPVWVTILVAIGFELLALWVIRDNLTLNVLMLLYPIEAIRTWQGG